MGRSFLFYVEVFNNKEYAIELMDLNGEAQKMERQREDTYILDPENIAEMARLELQGKVLTKGMGGILVEYGNTLPEGSQRVLDLGCGPGEWVREVAQAFPHVEVTGLDISKIMIAYAQAMVQDQHLENAHFVQGNVVVSLPFPDNHFDLVNARFLGVVIKGDRWQAAVSEWARVVRPGGSIRLTELDDKSWSNKPASQQLALQMIRVARKNGYGFGESQDAFNITSMLPLLLERAGCSEIHEYPTCLSASAGSEYHKSLLQDYRVIGKLIGPLLQTLGLSREEIEQMYLAMLREMASPDFQGEYALRTVSARKPSLQ
jgi:ubiquinone/menaquinone biosynthesis C-methylase UbiE